MRVNPVFRGVVINRPSNKDVEKFETKLVDIQQEFQVPIEQEDDNIHLNSDSEKMLEMLKAYNIKFEVEDVES